MTLPVDATRTMINKVSAFHPLDAERVQAGWRGERRDRQQAGQARSRTPVGQAA